MTSIQGDLSANDLRAHRELEELVIYIQKARSEISAIRPDSIREEEIPTAHSELDAVVSATEEATGVFLDVAEQLEEEALARNIMDKLQMIGNEKSGLYLFDRDLEQMAPSERNKE